MGENELPLVSILVPTRNSAGTLALCLASVRAQTYPHLEIIVIDNFSSDETLKIALNYRARVFKAGDERSRQLNFGAKNASGEYIFRVDSDMKLESDIVGQCITSCLTRKLDAIAIRTVPDTTRSIWARIRSIEQGNFYDGDSNIAVTFFNRDVFLRLGGFDETLVAGEDYDLHNRFVSEHFKFGLVAAKQVHLGEPRRLAEVARKHYYYGKTAPLFLRKNAKNNIGQMSPVRLLHLLGKKDPSLPSWFAAPLVVYQFVRYTAAIAGALSTLHINEQRWQPRRVTKTNQR